MYTYLVYAIAIIKLSIIVFIHVSLMPAIIQCKLWDFHFRIRRNDSRRLTTKPHDLLSDDDITTESLQSHDYDTISIATTVASSKFSDDSECMKEASLGGYLGLFSCKNHQKITEKELNGMYV